MIDFSNMVGYNDNLDPERQVDIKEDIACIIYEYQQDILNQQENSCQDETLTGEDCHDLADLVIYKLLREFRPDLFDDYKG